MVKRSLAAWLLALAFSGSVGCAVLAGLDGERHIDASASSSGGTGGGDADTCAPFVAPGPPAIMDGGGSEELVFALYSIDIGEVNVAMSTGFDLDGVCTCPGATSCAEPPWATATHCDGPGGRDDATGRAFEQINAAFAPANVVNSAQLSQQIDDGAWTLLVRVRDYDGQRDDDQVRVALYATPGLMAQPKWDGSDAWAVADVSLSDGMTVDMPVVETSAAYVTGDVLVASFPSAKLVFLGGGIRLELDLSSFTLSAPMVTTDAGARRLVGGTIGARWQIPSLFSDLSSLRISGNPLCVGSSTYNLVKKKLCAEVDLGAGAADAPCDALSFGMGFDAYPAKLGAVMPLKPPGGSCPVDKDPKNDTCGP